MKSIPFILALICAADAVSIDHQFELFKLRYAKTYTTNLEHDLRKGIFGDNVKYIEKHNAEAALGLHSYTLKVNKFADMTHKEFLAQMTSSQKMVFKPVLNAEQVDTSSLPDTVDWRDKGYVTSVKNQEYCGTCWAFSATGALEGANFKKTGKLVSFSEQNLVDCVYPDASNCSIGGYMTDAFTYVIKNGIVAESDYPYIDYIGKCAVKSSSTVFNMEDYVNITQGSESSLQKACAEQGPVAVAINATHLGYQFHDKGVLDPDSCSSELLDHGVLVVGYGTYEGKDYWLIKNSWGTDWGTNGYFKLARNKNNKCGIATAASYPRA